MKACLGSWAVSLLYSMATLCVQTNHDLMAAAKMKACARDTCIGTMCIEENIHGCLHPHCSRCKAACIHGWGHERSNMRRFAHLHV
uniref:Putative secreted protein n=1 Tax=Amblyomma cajennense TaxID=34607 RepID=A0A023FBC0_AMBCJ